MVVRVYGGMYNIDMHLFHKREFNEKMDRQNMYGQAKYVLRYVLCCPSVSLNS